MTLSSSARTGELKHRIETREARIGIIGMGYVGLPLALLFCDEHFQVTGFDIDPRKVETLNKGGSYILRISETRIQQARHDGFKATLDYGEIAQMDVVIMCVPTPLDDYHEPDLSHVRDTVRSIAPHIHAGQLIILESTTYPGTTEEVVVPLQVVLVGGKALAPEIGLLQPARLDHRPHRAVQDGDARLKEPPQGGEGAGFTGGGHGNARE